MWDIMQVLTIVTLLCRCGQSLNMMWKLICNTKHICDVIVVSKMLVDIEIYSKLVAIGCRPDVTSSKLIGSGVRPVGLSHSWKPCYGRRESVLFLPINGNLLVTLDRKSVV